MTLSGPGIICVHLRNLRFLLLNIRSEERRVGEVPCSRRTRIHFANPAAVPFRTQKGETADYADGGRCGDGWVRHELRVAPGSTGSLLSKFPAVYQFYSWHDATIAGPGIICVHLRNLRFLLLNI